MIERAEVWAWRMIIKLGFPVGLYTGGVKLKSCQPLMLINGVACVCSGVGKSRNLEVLCFCHIVQKFCPLTSFLAVGHIFIRTQERKEQQQEKESERWDKRRGEKVIVLIKHFHFLADLALAHPPGSDSLLTGLPRSTSSSFSERGQRPLLIATNTGSGVAIIPLLSLISCVISS